jgi:mono/diheme cytochrome c family protein
MDIDHLDAPILNRHLAATDRAALSTSYSKGGREDAGSRSCRNFQKRPSVLHIPAVYHGRRHLPKRTDRLSRALAALWFSRIGTILPENRREGELMNLRNLRVIGILVAGWIAGSSLLALQTPTRSVNDGVYTDQQAARGQAIYKARCTSCHGDGLAGRSGPPLAGNDFAGVWHVQPLSELANKIQRTMPRDPSARLTDQETADVLAYVLQLGKFPSGRAELVINEAALKQVGFPAPAITASKPADSAGLSLPPSGNVAQVMRGILFPSSNIIFTVQTIDPGAKKPPVDTTGGGFDWFTWGGSVYPGWDVVDYAAISLAESAKLMLTPGRRCENGRPVPVSDPDWIRFTRELETAGNAAYKASQTRNQETVSNSTNQLNDSCMNCHRMFRGRTHCVKP